LKLTPHRLLARQLKKSGLGDPSILPGPEAWQRFLEQVNQAYGEADQDRYLLERSLTLSSQEMQQQVAEHARIAQTLQQRESRNQALLNALPDLMFRIGRDGTVLDLKGPEQEMYLPPDRVIGRRLAEIMPPELVEKADKHIQIALTNREMEVFDFRLDWPQESRSYEARMVVSGVDEVLVVVRNITERMDAEKQRLALMVAQEQARLLQEFLGTVSHYLRTPLSVINTSIHLFERLNDPQTQKAKLELVKTQTALLEKLIADILVASELDNTQSLTRTSLNVNDLLYDIVARYHDLPEARGITLTTDMQEGLPPIPADGNELSRALVYLLENALDYTSAGGSITFRSAQNGQFIVIKISDTGSGIAAEDLPKVFDRFYRSDTLKIGSGLGLVIVKRIVELHRGNIVVESQKGKGTEFRIFLPIFEL